MRGQWLGKYSGTTSGNIMINVDEVDDHFEAVAYLRPSVETIPSSIATLATLDKSREQTASARVFPIDPRTGAQGDWNAIKSLYPEGVVHSSKSDVTLELLDNKLRISGTSEIGVVFFAELSKPSESPKSKIVGQKMSWLDFKAHISSISNSSYLFRGQQKGWSLCTSFHRRGRYRMSEFTSHDVKQLHQRLSAITTHFFDLTVPDQNGAFFNLLQHHGYPTPLLDWSHSPYVASFFAFRDWPIGYSKGDYARIYIFNNSEWQKHYPQIRNIDPPFPHLSVMEFIAIDNPRMVPQQAATTVTNLHDIEAYILERENETNAKFLQAIDIPASEREVAMRDLRIMGITAGSMFPGVDGMCEELRERNFDR